MPASDIVHGERVVDGNAGTLTALTLYESGSVTARTLDTTKEFLFITDILITTESAGDVVLVADSAAAGRYIVSAGLAANAVFTHHFEVPYVCPRGVVPKFSGPGTNRSTCVIQGWIQQG